jgi:hypothetical protein
LIWFFLPVRQALISDIFGLLKIRIDTAKVEPMPIDYGYERDQHFEQLQKVWEVRK